VTGPTALVLVHPSDADVDWVLPPAEWGAQWTVAFDTADADPPPGRVVVAGGGVRPVTARSVVVLVRPT
jgi:hypothetical protein